MTLDRILDQVELDGHIAALAREAAFDADVELWGIFPVVAPDVLYAVGSCQTGNAFRLEVFVRGAVRQEFEVGRLAGVNSDDVRG